VDVSQDVIISEHDCGTVDGIEIRPIIESGEVIEPLRDRIIGRVSLESIKDPIDGSVIVRANEEIGEETHEGDQILFFVEGDGEAILEGESSPVHSGDYVFVPAGTLHNFVNTGSEALRLLTTYAPPEHPHGTVHRTKAEADAAEER